ncbi:flavin reductase [Methylovirgula sp. 4M-Z18]|uniref:flavin reductase n=1 Tax=Methylovirgula sp. 4M-Z18 TaxID=2293567 RepID=UPI000E2E698A|nr:flavin reductase [Methylovirgula sp. 4M-Z18]RFB78968.1 hypothetical protein DYH55_14155 [Methylovirgula sp. 4M-Z18]
MTISNDSTIADAEDRASAHFRDAMSLVPSAVHILATDGPAGLGGLTASAVVSISDTPPTLLVSISQTSGSVHVFRENGVFSVNVLSGRDATLAEVFAGRTGVRGAARFDHGAWRLQPPRPPILRSAVAAFECRLTETRLIATHHVMIGAVTSAHIFAGGEEGLCYVRRQFKSV